jgi:hypothetical protein
MWVIFRVNVLRAMISGQFGKDTDSFVEFYVNEYDACIKRGGDFLHGVPVINGNVQGMKDIIKDAMKKGQENGGENFNLLEEIYPKAFDAYWMGAEMAPIPNPLLKPAGWVMTPPAPGTISNIGPSPIIMAATAAKNKATKEALQLLEDELKKQIVTIAGIGGVADIEIPVYETAIKIINKESLTPTDKKSKEFYDRLKTYFTRPNASLREQGMWYAFIKLNEEYGYAPVTIITKKIDPNKKYKQGNRSYTNVLGRFKLLVEENPEFGEQKPFELRLMEEYLAEYGHYMQFNSDPTQNKLTKTAKFITSMIGDQMTGIKGVLSGKGFSKEYIKNYTTIGSLEYEAHQINEKKLRADFNENVENFINGNIRELTTGVNQADLEEIILANPIIKNAISVIKKLKEAKKKKPSIGSQIKKAFKFPFPKLPSKKKLIEEARKQAEEQAKQQIIKPIEDMLEEAIIQPIEAMIQQAVDLADSIPNPKPTKAEIKQFVKDTINGVVPKISLPGISLPKIPKKEELKQMVKDAINGMIPDIPGIKLPKVPTLAQIESMVYDMVLKLVPNIPNIFFIPPTLSISASTNILVEPFITMAQSHLANTGGTLSVTSQYPPPLPPGPALIQWTGYNVMNGPKIPLPSYTMKIPEVPDLGSIVKLPPLPKPDFSNVTEIFTLPNAPQLPNVSLPKLPTLPKIDIPKI